MRYGCGRSLEGLDPLQPILLPRASWVSARQAPVSSTAWAMASGSCFLRPVSGCSFAHREALALMLLHLRRAAFLRQYLRQGRTAISLSR
jgi:hypothetical protein